MQNMSLTRSKSMTQPTSQQQELEQPTDMSDLQLRKKISSSFTRQLQLNTAPATGETYAIVNSILRSTINFNACKICQNKIQLNQLISFGNCQHKFCQQCLIQYCLYKIKVNEDVYCPQQGCKQKLSEHNIIYKHLPEQMQQKFREHVLWKKSLQNPNVKLCPNEKCAGGQVDLLKIPPQCRKCLTKYCKECMMAYHLGQCDKNFQEHFKQWKRCPKCKVFIQKNQGCNHMTCRCGHQFCFVCMADWQNSHYECIQGNDRLFFNDTQSMTRKQALKNLVGMILLLPLLFVAIALIIVFGAVVAFLIGLFAAPCIGTGCMRDCGLICRLLCLFVFIPIFMIIGSVLAVLFSVFAITIPLSKRLIRRYGNTFKFLAEQLTKKQDKPLVPLVIASSGAMMQQI